MAEPRSPNKDLGRVLALSWLASDGDGDRAEALSLCNRGLLASLEVGPAAFAATGRRFIQQVIEPLEEAARSW